MTDDSTMSFRRPDYTTTGTIRRRGLYDDGLYNNRLSNNEYLTTTDFPTTSTIRRSVLFDDQLCSYHHVSQPIKKGRAHRFASSSEHREPSRLLRPGGLGARAPNYNMVGQGFNPRRYNVVLMSTSSKK
jgi:hypothetical protein